MSVSRKLVTYKDACEMLGIKKTLLHTLIKQGVLDRRTMPVPNRRRPLSRISVESIERYQKGSAGVPVPTAANGSKPIETAPTNTAPTHTATAAEPKRKPKTLIRDEVKKTFEFVTKSNVPVRHFA